MPVQKVHAVHGWGDGHTKLHARLHAKNQGRVGRGGDQGSACGDGRRKVHTVGRKLKDYKVRAAFDDSKEAW